MRIYNLLPVRRCAPPMERQRPRWVGGSIFVFLFSLFVSFSFSAQALDPCDKTIKYVPIAERYTKGVFFMVKKCHVAPSYLLGTLHSDDPRITEMLGIAFSKLAYTNTANFEIKFSPATVTTTAHSMFFEPSSVETLQSLIGIEEYTKLTRLMSQARPGMPETTYYRMRPWAAAVMLSEPPEKGDGTALDVALQKYAETRNVQVNGLETVESQLAIFSSLTQPQQVGLLKDAVDNYPEIQKDVQEMFAAYLAQDLNKIKNLADQSFDTYSDKELASVLKVEMIDKRNLKMVEAMSPKIDLGAAFIAIGALHLPGKEGVLRQLEDKGYYIESVSTTLQ